MKYTSSTDIKACKLGKSAMKSEGDVGNCCHLPQYSRRDQSVETDRHPDVDRHPEVQGED